MASKSPRKTQAKKSAVKKAAAKKLATKKSAPRKPAAKKPAVKKLAAKKSARSKQDGATAAPKLDVKTVEQAMDEWMEAWPKMVAQAWSDPAFQERLIREPEQVAREQGLHVQNTFRIEVKVGTTPPTLLINIPPRPDDLPVTEDLAKDAVERKTCNNGCTF